MRGRILSFPGWAGAVFLSLILSTGSFCDETRTARTFYTMLTGGSLQPENPLFSQIVEAIRQDNLDLASHIITDNPSLDPTFYDLAIRQFCAVDSAAEDPAAPLSEGAAICLGSTAGGFPVEDMYSSPVTYYVPNFPASPYSPSSSDAHFTAFDATGQSPVQKLARDIATQPNGVGFVTAPSPYGVDGWKDGTKRRVYKLLVNHSWCSELEDIQNSQIPNVYTRRDHIQSDAPGNDIVHKCYSCHARMDAVYGAFTHYKWDEPTRTVTFLGEAVFDDQLNEQKRPNFDWTSSSTGDAALYKQNELWHFFYLDSEQPYFGIPDGTRGSFHGTTNGLNENVGRGLSSFVSMVLGSGRFNSCFATRVSSQVLGKVWTLSGGGADLKSQDEKIKALAAEFKQSRNLVDLFRKAAITFLKRK